MTAIEAIGGNRPLKVEEFARRAHAYALNPNRNPVREILIASDSYEDTPPLLGIFNDIPWHKFRESDAQSWAKAGFSWVINDAEHSQWEGWYGREQNATLARAGILPVQRLPREARSTHGDAFQLGARATMRPYGVSYEDAEAYCASISFPVPGRATPYSRGAYPVRNGDGSTVFTPETLRKAETETQGWIQFETGEYLLDEGLRDEVLELMTAQGRHKMCGFVGPFDAIMREGESREIGEAIDRLFTAAAKRDIHMGRVVGSGSMQDPKQIENAMVRAIERGVRLIALHYLTSELAYYGAVNVSEPFFRACERCGF